MWSACLITAVSHYDGEPWAKVYTSVIAPHRFEISGSGYVHVNISMPLGVLAWIFSSRYQSRIINWSRGTAELKLHSHSILKSYSKLESIDRVYASIFIEPWTTPFYTLLQNIFFHLLPRTITRLFCGLPNSEDNYCQIWHRFCWFCRPLGRIWRPHWTSGSS